MKITRRNFVQAIGTAAAITVSGGGLKAALGQTKAELGIFPIPPSSSKTLFSLTSSQVLELVGRSFVATSPCGHSTELVLSEVNQLRRRANSRYSGECFSVIFKSRNREEKVEQAVFEMRGAGLDQVSALLVPTSRGGRELELVVNTLRG